MNGAGRLTPGPGGAGGTAIGGGGGAAAGLAGAGPGSGPSGSVRAPGAAFGGSGTGVPGTSGCTWPGRPAIGIPGVGGRPFGLGGDVATSIGAGKLPPNGARSNPAQGNGFPGRGNKSGDGVYEHGVPGGTAGPG